MDGAEAHRQSERVFLATSAWVGAHADKQGLDSFLTAISPREPLAPEALDRMLASASVGLPVISMEEYLSKRGRRS